MGRQPLRQRACSENEAEGKQAACGDHNHKAENIAEGSSMSDLSKGLDWFLANPTETIGTVAKALSWSVEPRQTIVEKPRAGYPEGVNAAPVNSTLERSADVITKGVDFYQQLKGLFGLGYPTTETQPVSPIKKELTPATAPVIAGMSAGTIAVIAIALLFLFKK